jgi:MOSC domain-containing protein YiiM
MALVLDVALPPDPAIPTLVRSVAACLASVTEIDIADLPRPSTDLSGSLARWRSWLAGRGAGLVPIAAPDRFNWPGYWIAIVGQRGTEPQGSDNQVAVLMFGTPSGVVLSPQDPEFLGRAAADLAVRQGFVVAILDPALPPSAGRPRPRGHVVALALAEVATALMREVPRTRALAGRGLAGDRYAAKAGTFTPAGGAGRGYDLTLIQAEVLDQLRLPGGRRLHYADARRNVVSQGIDLNALVGRRFRVGDVECLGQRLCEPCAHLERLTTRGVLRSLIHRGGLRADILTDGDIEVGSVIETVD